LNKSPTLRRSGLVLTLQSPARVSFDTPRKREDPDEESSMASKRLLIRSAAREKILSGATALADAVRIALDHI
jgi:hypothetical protein